MFRIDRRLVNISGAPSAVTSSISAEAEAEREALNEEMQAIRDELELLKDERSELEQVKLELQNSISTLKKDAETAGEDILRRASEEAEALKAAAQSEGFDVGKKEAEKLLNDARAGDEEQLRLVIAEVGRAKAEMLSGIESGITDLCLAIVRKVFGQANDESGLILDSLIVNTLSQMKREGKITIHVSNSEYERFFSGGSATYEIGGDEITASVVADPYMLEGDLIIDAGGETVNAGVDSQLKYIDIAFKRAQ